MKQQRCGSVGISWMKHVRNDEILRKENATRKFTLAITKRRSGLLGHKVRKECLENFTLSGYSGDNKNAE